jgi:hypothetical protein
MALDVETPKVEPAAPGGPAAPEGAAAPRVPRAAPVWIFPLFLAGLVLIYVGERVLVSLGTGRWVVSLLGLALLLSATTLRYSPRFRVGGERKHIEQLLGALSVLGVLGVLVHFGISDWGAERLGLGSLEEETRDRLESVLTVAWIVLIGVSVVPMAFAETASYPMRFAERPESRRVRAAAAAGLKLVLAAAYTVLFVFAARGLKMKADYSYFKTSEPSDSTRKIVLSLDDPLTVRGFFPEVNEVRSEVERYLSKLAPGSPNLKLEILDRLLVPKLAQDLRVTQDGMLVLSYGKASESLRLGGELNDETRKKLKTLDRDLQEVLLKLVRSRRTAYFTVGHEELNDAGRGGKKEEGTELLQLLLKKQNYTIKDLGLGQGLGREVPDDADVVFVIGPARPFSPEEVSSLRRYADRGGKLFMALDPDSLPVADMPLPGEALPGEAPPAGKDKPARKEPAAEGLQALAGAVGLTLDPTVLANDKYYTVLRHNDSDHARLATNQYSSHASVSTLSRNSSRLGVVLIGAGSLDKAPNTANTVDFAVRSMSGTFADLNHNYRLDAPAEKQLTYNLAAAVSRPLGGKKPPPKKPGEPALDTRKDEMRAFVVTDSGALTDIALANVFGNQVLVVDAVRWLGGEESFAGQTNAEEDLKIEHTKQKDLLWYYGTIFGAPAAVLGLGLYYSRRTRRPRRRAKQ